MKTVATKWILTATCAALLAAPLTATARQSRDSRHPDSRRRPEYSRNHRPSQRHTYRPPPPQPYYVYSSAAWAPLPAYYHAPPPPPPVVYYQPTPVVYCPPPAIVYPMRPGVNIVFSF